ncbi:MarR family winged helix-turn-helix transcriptional regulator [Stackebrandtia nassauensis]|uniref:Transcriptional regulator, MarR family n=1 Tax=Stackebrandtia nassauensis (strain DSM 44728 / CIP 108903 / NRRL B-16338 / NBRC 102104 / LLR-40K-21) TaxID=446470 RepID=D3QAQ6_STANL|nr:MarR family transcriptional regulator [Stackebrandtia nassauensis]ADD44702.1 transcriptional regulator, MarR family [Stackebrandtia nassauensis DSM 44728]
MDSNLDGELPSRLTDKPTWLIMHASPAAHRLFIDAMIAGGTRRYHYAILATLAQFGPASQAAIGRRCKIDRSDMVTALNELSENGLVTRDPDPADRRRNIITITADGNRKLRKLDTLLERAHDELCAGLTPDERAQLVRLLNRLLAGLG